VLRWAQRLHSRLLMSGPLGRRHPFKRKRQGTEAIHP
jgi:hypothetical protein